MLPLRQMRTMCAVGWRNGPICRALPPADLVFIQNGMLQPWLDSKGLGENTQAGAEHATVHVQRRTFRSCRWRTPRPLPRTQPGINSGMHGPCTACALKRRAWDDRFLVCPWGVDWLQVLVYFAVAKKGDKPTDGKTDVNPEGLTAAYGKHAQAVAQRLEAGGLSCKVLDKQPFTQAMLEKLVWIRCGRMTPCHDGGALTAAKSCWAMSKHPGGCMFITPWGW